jgi:glycosyltransferase involved in cell wall biosynthesis
MRRDAGSDNTTDMTVVFSKTFGGPYHQELESALNNHGIEVRKQNGLNGQLLRDAVFGDVDVLHLHFLHQFLPSSSAVGLVRDMGYLWLKLIILRVAGVQSTWTIHDYYGRHTELRALRRVAKAGTILIVDNVIVHCQCAVSLVLEEFRIPSIFKDKFSVIPHGNFIQRYPDMYSESEARDALAVDDDSTVFLSLGGLKSYKRIPSIVEAFTDLSEDVELIIAGGAVDETVAEKVRKRASQSPNIYLTIEHIERNEMGKYLRAADFAIYNYSKRLTSGAVMAATSLGLPVIASNTGCLQSMVHNSDSILYPVEQDGDGLRKALEEAMVVEMTGQKNLELAEKRSWEKVAKMTIATYQGEGVIQSVS